MRDYFDDLFRFTGWANGRVLEALGQHEREAGLKLMNHVVGAQEVWLARVAEQHVTDWDLWESRPVSEVLASSQRSVAAWRDFVETRTPEDWRRVCSYANQRGERWRQPLREIVAHVINHGTHHRGQVAMLLRQGGHPPPALDYIAYLREPGRCG